MCGRYTTTMDPETLYGVFEAEPEEDLSEAEPHEHQPGPGEYGGDVPRRRVVPLRYNIAPTDTVPIVRIRPGKETSGRLVTPARWGLVPSWAKDPSVGSRMFNARSDSVLDKPAFRKPFERRRCLVPASGYYEWRKPADGAARTGSKQPKQAFYLTPADGSVMAFAGLWEYWKGPDGEPLISTTVITTDAVGELTSIHPRMPLILPASDWAFWLDPGTDAADLAQLLTSPDPELVAGLELRPVGPRVGNVRYDDPGLIDRVDPEDW